jgi:5-methyltetrahydrofolate corrinoid/iron sulfur protein methyltransferase
MIIIGENINATIPRIKDLIVNHDETALTDLAMRQEKAGADIIDLNVATGTGTAEDEVRDMQWLVERVMDKVKCRICVDSADTAVLRAGIQTGGDRVGLVNSVKATDRNIAEVLPMVSGFGLPVIALAMDEGGIPADAATRLRACEKVIRGAEAHKVPVENIFFDPLVMPVSTDIRQGVTTLETLQGIKKEFPQANTVLAASNVSFGLQKRTLINQALIHMAQYFSVDALLVNPLNEEFMLSVKAGEMVMGRDRHCRKYSRAVRRMDELRITN